MCAATTDAVSPPKHGCSSRARSHSLITATPAHLLPLKLPRALSATFEDVQPHPAASADYINVNDLSGAPWSVFVRLTHTPV